MMWAITLWQPWASLVALGCKQYEFRGWHPHQDHIGKRIAIHAGARLPKREEIQAMLLRVRREDKTLGLLNLHVVEQVLENVLTSPGCLPMKRVVCTALLDQPIRGIELARALGQEVFDPMGMPTNWGWPLRYIEVVTDETEVKGDRGLWQWQADARP